MTHSFIQQILSCLKLRKSEPRKLIEPAQCNCQKRCHKFFCKANNVPCTEVCGFTNYECLNNVPDENICIAGIDNCFDNETLYVC